MNKKYQYKKVIGSGLVILAGMIALPSYASKDVTLAVYSNFITMDPYDTNETLSQSVAKSFYQGLYGFDKDSKLTNVLAESSQVDETGKIYTFKLRQGVKFHDGTDFNAEAVKANFDRVTNPENHLKRYNMFNRIKSTEVIDPYTVKVTLKEPFSAFLNILGHPSAVMISPTALNKYGKDIAFHPTGTGPFVLDEWNATDFIKGKKFDQYWKAGYPKIDTIIWRPVVENNTRAAMMKTGEAQFAYTVPFEQIKLLEKDDKLQISASPSIIERYISINMTKKPFDDVRVRQALNFAINKQALSKVAFSGYATPATGIVPVGVEYAKEYGAWPYDPAKARELLKEAGYPNGFTLTLWSSYNNTTSTKVVQFIQQQLTQVGIKAEIESLEAGQRVARVESIQTPEESKVQLYYSGWSSSTMEADWAITPLLSTKSFPPKLYNTAYYSNAEVDKKLEEAIISIDPVKKQQLYAEIQDQIWNDVPWIYLTNDQQLFVHNKKLSGINMLLDGSINFDDIDLSE